MSATMISEPMVLSTTTTQEQTMTASSTTIQMEIESARCDCCGLTEECTPEYIERIRERYMGKWLCGLCSEAVTYEFERMMITMEEALNCHLSVCRNFRATSPPACGSPAADVIAAISHLLRRSLECGSRSTPASPTREAGEARRAVLARSDSCFPDISG